MDTASSIATMGVNTVGTRQIAEANAKEDIRNLAIARRVLLWATLVLGSLGALIVWMLRRPLAQRVLGSTTHANVVGWLAVGVALTVIAASQGALIQGMRRIGDLARASVYGAILNTVVGIAVIWKWGDLLSVLRSAHADCQFPAELVVRLPVAARRRLPHPRSRNDASMENVADHWRSFDGRHRRDLSRPTLDSRRCQQCPRYSCPGPIPGILDDFPAIH